MHAAYEGHEACAKALLRANANTELRDKSGYTALQYAEEEGHTALAELIRQHTAPPPQPPAASPAPAEPAGAAMSSSAPLLPEEICAAAAQGELPKVVKWLRKGGHVDALCSWEDEKGISRSAALLHTAAANGQLAVAKEVLKRGATVDLLTNLGRTPLMGAALGCQPAVLLLLLEHSANPDLQNVFGSTALMAAAEAGHGGGHGAAEGAGVGGEGEGGA